MSCRYGAAGSEPETDMGLWVGLVLLALAGIAIVTRSDGGDVFGLDPSDFAVLAGGVAVLIFVGLSLGGAYRGRMGHALRDVATWAALALALVAGYSFRDEITGVAYRIAGELSPPGSAVSIEASPAGERAVRIRRRPDGHFAARVTVNGGGLSMLVDTGASTVVLKQSDASRLGIDTGNLRYSVPVQTANGVAYAAPVRLRSIAIGPIALTQIEALVAQPGALKESLLGMTFLSRLRSYEFSGDFLTLRG
jgi:aspartyl protease family protein